MTLRRDPLIPLIYDVGMNNGDDTAYYLKKGCRVVAIDANPQLCAEAQIRFSESISNGLLEVLNVGLTDQEGVAEFSINTHEHAISTFAPHKFAAMDWVTQDWTKVNVSTTRLSKIVQEYGNPWFIKIDVEFYDTIVLLDLLRERVLPPLISVEVQELTSFYALACMGYSQFRIVPGDTMHLKYGDRSIKKCDGTVVRHSFERSSSGPFDDDLPDPWIDGIDAIKGLLKLGVGWVDVHARLESRDASC